MKINHLLPFAVFESVLWYRSGLRFPCAQVGENSGENEALTQQFTKHLKAACLILGRP